MTEEEVLRELDALVRDPHRERLLEKFQLCEEAIELSELLGTALYSRKGYYHLTASAPSLPVPAGVIHPG